MNSPSFSRRFLMTQWAIAALYSLAVSLWILFYKVSPGSAFDSGISSERLIAVSLPAAFFILAAYSFRQALAGSGGLSPIFKYIFDRPSRITGTRFIAGIAAGVSILGLCLPGYYFGDYAELYVRIKPLMFWAGVLGLHLSMILANPPENDLYQKIKTGLADNHRFLRLSFWILLSFLLLWLFIVKTGLGISGHEDFWYEAGVPILPAQVLISVLAGLLFSKVEGLLAAAHPTRLDMGVFFGIWIIAALIWGLTPAPDSFFNPAPLPPNQEVYPYSDAAGYDLQSQSALIGQGLDNGRSVDNPIYPIFLVLVHLVGGQDYAANMALQAAILAVFPALVYGLGKMLFGRPLGIMAALMIALRGYNSIASASMINLASPKQMLTDFPAAIGVILSILTLLILFEKEHVRPAETIWHGAALGFAFLIRPTALVILAISSLVVFIKRLPLGRRFGMVLLVLSGFVIFILPWGIRNSFVGKNAVMTYLNKIYLVKDARFPETRGDKTKWSEKGSSTEEARDSNAQNSDTGSCSTTCIAGVILNHFLHNVTGSVLALPTSLIFDDLHHTLKSTHSVWLPTWTGGLDSKQVIILIASLGMLAAGIAASWTEKQTAGLIPLAVFIIYQLANSIGRTSGGRFIVPADWILLFYFTAGINEVLGKIYKPPSLPIAGPKAEVAFPARKWGMAAFLVFFLGAIPVLLEVSLFLRPIAAPAPLNASPEEMLSRSIYSADEIANFLEENNSVLLTGPAMYPRYYGYQAINHQAEGGVKSVKFPHLEFHLIDQRKTQPVVLYRLSPDQLPNGTQVIVLGCVQKNANYVDAIAIIANSSETTTYLRESSPTLHCPLQQPVCDNNGNCK